MKFLRLSSALLCAAAFGCADPHSAIKHVDGDTIWIDGTKYRLHGIDSPEPSHLARCELERELGEQASAFVEEITAGANLQVTHEYGMSFDRRVADISVNGRDWGEWLVAEGLAKRWDYDGGQPKPDWCKNK